MRAAVSANGVWHGYVLCGPIALAFSLLVVRQAKTHRVVAALRPRFSDLAAGGSVVHSCNDVGRSTAAPRSSCKLIVGGGSISPDEGAGRWLGLSACHPGCGERHRGPNLSASPALFLFRFRGLCDLLKCPVSPLPGFVPPLRLRAASMKRFACGGSSCLIFGFAAIARSHQSEAEQMRAGREWPQERPYRRPCRMSHGPRQRLNANSLPKMRPHRRHPDLFGKELP